MKTPTCAGAYRLLQTRIVLIGQALSGPASGLPSFYIDHRVGSDMLRAEEAYRDHRETCPHCAMLEVMGT